MFDECRVLISLSIKYDRFSTEHGQPKLFFRTAIIAIEVFEPWHQFVHIQADSSFIILMNGDKPFGSNIRHNKLFQYGFCRLLLIFFLFFTSKNVFFIFSSLFLIFYGWFNIQFKQWLHGKTKRMALIYSWTSDDCHVQDGTFIPAFLYLRYKIVADTYG